MLSSDENDSASIRQVRCLARVISGQTAQAMGSDAGGMTRLLGASGLDLGRFERLIRIDDVEFLPASDTVVKGAFRIQVNICHSADKILGLLYASQLRRKPKAPGASSAGSR